MRRHLDLVGIAALVLCAACAGAPDMSAPGMAPQPATPEMPSAPSVDPRASFAGRYELEVSLSLGTPSDMPADVSNVRTIRDQFADLLVARMNVPGGYYQGEMLSAVRLVLGDTQGTGVTQGQKLIDAMNRLDTLAHDMLISGTMEVPTVDGEGKGVGRLELDSVRFGDTPAAALWDGIDAGMELVAEGTGASLTLGALTGTAPLGEKLLSGAIAPFPNAGAFLRDKFSCSLLGSSTSTLLQAYYGAVNNLPLGQTVISQLCDSALDAIGQELVISAKNFRPANIATSRAAFSITERGVVSGTWDWAFDGKPATRGAVSGGPTR